RSKLQQADKELLYLRVPEGADAQWMIDALPRGIMGLAEVDGMDVIKSRHCDPLFKTTVKQLDPPRGRPQPVRTSKVAERIIKASRTSQSPTL
ncbi:hypothetical protein CYMTET_19627, partial [Cymbomonas tetramitiformis]